MYLGTDIRKQYRLGRAIGYDGQAVPTKPRWYVYNVETRCTGQINQWIGEHYLHFETGWVTSVPTAMVHTRDGDEVWFANQIILLGRAHKMANRIIKAWMKNRNSKFCNAIQTDDCGPRAFVQTERWHCIEAQRHPKIRDSFMENDEESVKTCNTKVREMSTDAMRKLRVHHWKRTPGCQTMHRCAIKGNGIPH